MFQYENGNDYVSEGMYRIVDQRGRIGYADESGRAVIKPRFAFGFPFENGKAKVTDKGEMKEVPGSDGEGLSSSPALLSVSLSRMARLK